MTVDDVKARVAMIEAISDQLYADVLRAIAKAASNPVDLALAALATKNLDFSRWYA